MDAKKYANFRAFKEDIETLKVVAALRRESMVHTFKHLVQQEYIRLQRQQKEECKDAALQKDQD
ncbi:hypothetical protein KSD_28860 [Ktedonobacter sp. SOSP1-85]|nr:hypothetical protein KSD_28860 [Ktedonobacter sp. SOSP1-85]